VAAVTTITVQGLPATLRKLETLPGKIQKRSMQKAIRAGGAPFVRAARSNAPRLTGLFKRSLDQKIVSYRGGQVVISIVGQKSEVRARKKVRKGRGGISGRGDLVPIHFVEEGIRPHDIPKEGKGPIAIRTPSGRVAIVARIRHPGVKGRHPIRRAADSSAGAAVAAFEAKLSAEVDREAAT
jgi:hypothetical protein